MRKTPLRAVSKKRRIVLRDRRKLVAAISEAHEGYPPCARCSGPAQDLHEVLSRARGGSPADPENCIPLCRPCHSHVTEHPLEAKEMGLSK